MSENIIQIRIDLKGKTKDMFQKIKDKYNFETNTEVLRYMVKKAYDAEFPEEK